MKKQILTLMLGAAVLVANPAFEVDHGSLICSFGQVKAEIIEVDSIEQIPFSKYTSKDCMGFDFDDSLWTTEQKIMRRANFDARKAFLAEIRTQGGDERVSFAYDHSKYRLVEEGLKPEIDKLNERQVMTFGFSARRTGKATKDQKTFVEDDTLGMLKQLNINFQSNHLKNMILEGMNPTNPQYATNRSNDRLTLFTEPHDAMVKDGVIFTNNIDKGLVLGEVFKRLGFFPETFALVDDLKKNHIAVEEAIKNINETFKTNIKYEGYYYTKASKLDNTLNPEVVKLQKAELLKENPRFLLEEEALQQLRGQ